MAGLFGKLFGDGQEREIARLRKSVEQINALEPAYQALSDAQLRAKTDEFRRRRARGESLDSLMPEAFAAMREATRRTIGMRHYDVQLIGGMVLHQGKIVEMKTGEGKTLVATLPLYLNGLDLNPEWVERAEERWGKDPDRWEFAPLDGIPVGRGVHLVTVNDYLARRDGGWNGPAFHLLGLRVGLIIPQASAVYDPEYIAEDALLQDDRLVHWRPAPRREAYNADITYGTSSELGFDYLRDNMVHDLSECVQRELNFAIIDEIDNILIDEARTPLIISGPSDEPSDLYRRFADIVRRLKPDKDYEVEERTQVVTLTDEGISRLESLLGIPKGESLYDPQHAHMLPYLDNALHAHAIYKRDRDYIVKDGQVIIVDEFTGRMLVGRRYAEGLHQAIEAKEGLAVQRESLTYGTITVQNYFRMYRRLAGMTGTAATEKEEFHTIYRLDVVVLPTNVEYRAHYGDLVERRRRATEIPEVSFVGVLNGREDNVTITTYERGDPPEERYFRRLDLEDAIYLNSESKFQAIVREIETLHQAGRPVLVGTIAVETSEALSRRLKRQGIPHNVLNAKQHEQEALVIAQAGRPGAVTIATNMAGRGVDIILGGDPLALAARTLQKELEARLSTILKQVASGQVGNPSPAMSEEALTTARTLMREYADYERARAEGGSALPTFLADMLIAQGSLPRTSRADGIRLARYVLQGDWEQAGHLAQESLGLSLISDIQRLREPFEQAKDAQQYVTMRLSSTYHNLLMALIRLAVNGREDEARALMARYPELPPGVLETIRQIRDDCRRDQERVRAMGGLHVIGTERHEARRIDNQLRGRAGRQGDPGSSRFFLSLEDDLMRRFGGERVQGLMARTGMEDTPLEFGILSKTVESAQTRVEGYNFDLRKHVLEYDDVVNKQREVIYAQRRQVLSEPDLRDQVLRMLHEEIGQLVATHCAGSREEWDLKGLHAALRTFLPLPPTLSPESWEPLSAREIEQQLCTVTDDLYDALYQRLGQQVYQEAEGREETLAALRDGADPLRRAIYRRVIEQMGDPPDDEMLSRPLRRLPEEVQFHVQAAFADELRRLRDRQIVLRAVDSLWVRYLTDLSILREGIGLRAFGQQDPLVAFRKEAHELYQNLLGQIQSQVARTIFLFATTAPAPRRQPPAARRLAAPVRPLSPQPAQTPSGPGTSPPGRNDPCWCGSGKKYKLCHMRQDMEARGAPKVASRPPGARSRGKRRHR
jgi:preprotein translocase subunit SecA